MGRLVYVREVSVNQKHLWSGTDRICRIVRLNLGSQLLQVEAAADSMVAHAVVSVETLDHHIWVVVEEAMAVKSTLKTFVPFEIYIHSHTSSWTDPLTLSYQLPYTVGWQDLKDLFRQAGMIC